MVGDGSSGRIFGSASEPLPPALTQTNHRGATTPDPVLAPPFVPGDLRIIAAASAAGPESSDEGSEHPFEKPALPTDSFAAAAPEPTAALELTTEEPLEDATVEPAPEELLLESTDPFAGDPDALPEPMPWETPAVEPMPWDAPAVEPMPWEATAEPAPWSDERSDQEVDGVVEPAFGEDVSLTSDAILASAPEDEFPIDAFIIPEHAKRVPTGVPDPDHANHTDPSHELAERFEKLSRRLRAEDIESLLPSLARGDRFDALVAGFIAGYFSARDL